MRRQVEWIDFTSKRILVATLFLGLMAAAMCPVAHCSSTKWKHLSSKNGDLAVPGASNEQTAALILDVDKDGVNDFVVACRIKGPAVIWFRRQADGWKRYVVDNDTLAIEAGATSSDIDGDGDLDFVMGGDWQSNQVWWWENPYPNYDPNTPWKRRCVKNSGEKKHHHQLFGDFDGDGKEELVFWNQGASKLFLAEIPADPKTTEQWPYTAIYTYTGGEHEGLAKADVDGNGKLDIVGGGRWFKHEGGTSFTPHVIDDQQRFGKAAAGQLKKGGWAETVFCPGDAIGRLKWYEWDGSQWVAHDLLGVDIVHGHSLELADFDGDGNLDIFCAEMHTPGHKEEATMWVFFGDGKGNFQKTVIATGYGNHESQVGDLDGDGDVDILHKPYTWDAPRIDVWLNDTR
jgi:hypothetical protein